MSEQVVSKLVTGIFWDDATKYTLFSKDESFVEEVAYMMVTLHRTGA
jgi:hypothetical protein